MGLILRRLSLVATTSVGDFGVDIPFERGLVVLRADNSMGKSTCMQSILFALGMEGMLQQTHRVALQPVMTSRLTDEQGLERAVVESRVLLEIENDRGEVVTLRRFARHPNIDNRLITVWRGDVLTSGASDGFETFDLYARSRGSGTGELGIGPFLSNFVGWDLPSILLNDGEERLLYPELIFPLVYVEQRGGWRGIQASMPTYGIPEVRQRALEFILDLQVYERERQRGRLRQESQQHRSDWQHAVDGARTFALGRGMVLTNTPREIAFSYPGEDRPELRTLRDQRPLDEEVRSTTAELEALDVETDVALPPGLQPDFTMEQIRLQEAMSELELAQLRAAADDARLNSDRGTLGSLRAQIAHLEDDERRNRDAVTLQGYGSTQAWADEANECPVCHQSLPTALIGYVDRTLMSVDDNLRFVRQELEAFRSIEAESARAVELAAGISAENERHINELRGEIRALRSSLIRPENSPSVAGIEHKLRLEARLASFDELAVFLGTLEDNLSALAGRAAITQAELQSLPAPGLTAEEESKLAFLEQSFREQLELYRLESLPVGELSISADTYRPEREGVDLGFDPSASDGIRIVWSYLLALLECARVFPTNHPGLLLFDEPRQQSTAESSLAQLLARAAEAADFGQQVVFATSEAEERLQPMLANLGAQYIPFTGRLLKRS